jgi:hypothetical protein
MVPDAHRALARRPAVLRPMADMQAARVRARASRCRGPPRPRAGSRTPTGSARSRSGSYPRHRPRRWRREPRGGGRGCPWYEGRYYAMDLSSGYVTIRTWGWPPGRHAAAGPTLASACRRPHRPDGESAYAGRPTPTPSWDLRRQRPAHLTRESSPVTRLQNLKARALAIVPIIPGPAAGPLRRERQLATSATIRGAVLVRRRAHLVLAFGAREALPEAPENRPTGRLPRVAPPASRPRQVARRAQTVRGGPPGPPRPAVLVQAHGSRCAVIVKYGDSRGRAWGVVAGW